MAFSFLANKNNAGTTLAADVLPGDGTITVVSAAALPAATPYLVTVYLTSPADAVMEIMRVTNVVGEVLTVDRAQEGTAAVAHVDGDQVWNFPTAGKWGEVEDAINAHADSDGSSHPFINQDVRTVASPTFAGLGVDTPVRGTTSLWWRIQHVDISALPAKGAVGAVYTPQTANNLTGYRLDNAPSEEYLYFNTHIGNDWDAISDLELVVQFETNVGNGGGLVTDTVDFDLVMYYKKPGDAVQHTQDLDASVVMGQAVQYTHGQVTFTIDHDLVDHVVEIGDCCSFRLHLNTIDSEIDNVIVHHAMFRYKTEQVRAEV